VSDTDTGVHRYTASCTWRGSTAAGYDAYERSHEATAPPAAATLQLSSDPAFRGDPALLNPEQLLVLAASSCQLLSFLAVAARARIDVIEYRDDAEGEMPEDDLPMRITRITLRPQIVVWEDVSEARVRHLVEVAHRECFIANSLTTEVVVEPDISIID
jgi:organic hydroperoxide reductase OsmC/OhrA